MKALGLVTGNYPYQDAPLRVGEMSSSKCHERFERMTFRGAVQLTDDAMRDVKLACTSVEHKPLCTSGMIAHFMDKVRKDTKGIAEKDEFMVKM